MTRPKVVSVTDAARFVRRSRATIYAWFDQRRLTRYYLDGRLVVALEELEQLRAHPPRTGRPRDI